MPQIEYLTEDNRRKYKVRKKHAIQYKCECGTLVTLETDMKVKKLTKCWKCQQKNS